MKTKLLNEVENIVSKGEIAHFEQFLLLSIFFSKVVYMWERVKSIIFGKLKDYL